MTGSIDFQRVDLGAGALMLKSVLGDSYTFGIVVLKDGTPELAWCSDSPEALTQLIEGIVAGQEGPETFYAALVKNCPEDMTLLVSGLDLDMGEDLACLTAIGPGKQSSVIDGERARLFFSKAASCLEAQINLTAENDRMAMELARHYEELNLIYQAEAHSKGTTNTDETLRQVVGDVLEFMEVDGAFLTIPGVKKWIFLAGTGLSKNEKQIKKTVASKFKDLKDAPKTIVLNREDAPKGASCNPTEHLLMILSPIRDLDKQVMGAVGCIRKPDGPAFETGDRKLIDAVGQRAGKIALMDLDPITGLMTRSGFEQRVREMISSPPLQNRHTAVCLINIDQFKLINDAYGVTTADELLKQLSYLLREHLKNRDVVARLEGDWFALLLCRMRSAEDGWNALERLKSHIACKSFPVENNLINITVRIGFLTIDKSIKTVMDVNTRAELALEEAKEKGGNCIHMFEQGSGKLADKMDQARYAAQIESLVEKGRFVLFCQPIVPLTGGAMHYEVLIRLMDDDGGIISPYRFLPAAEAYKKMTYIDRWVVENTCRLLEENAASLQGRNMTWGINLSGQSLQDESFMKELLEFLTNLPIPSAWLNFEITETVAIRNLDKMVEVINRIRCMGFDVFLDDFGTGYSSLGYLQKLPVSHLKIDGVFIRDMEKNGFNQVAVQSIVSLSKNLGIKTVAEFVENEENLVLLKKFGVDYAQGYHTGKPGDMAETLQKIEAQARPQGN